MNYQQLTEQRSLILLDAISGSTAYNLNVPGSDIDKKGIFILPKNEFYGFESTDQLGNETNDEVYFEIKRFMELLTKNNPNILELLNTPKDCIISRNPILDRIKTEDFLSKLCLDTFAGYAQTQIKKARGLNKKINKPLGNERKTVLDFCYVIFKNGSIPLSEWLEDQQFEQQDCGLTKPSHFRDVYLLYHINQLSPGSWLKGIVSGPAADDVQVSPVPKDIDPIATLNFNKDGYSTYCKEYREYREWEDKRNDLRYQSTLQHGKSYDAKNMMHTFRLLNMAEEIATQHQVIVKREDRTFLLKIRNGEYEFDELMVMVEEKMETIKALYATSTLPNKPDAVLAEQLLVEIREEFYRYRPYSSPFRN